MQCVEMDGSQPSGGFSIVPGQCWGCLQLKQGVCITQVTAREVADAGSSYCVESGGNKPSHHSRTWEMFCRCSRSRSYSLASKLVMPPFMPRFWWSSHHSIILS